MGSNHYIDFDFQSPEHWCGFLSRFETVAKMHAFSIGEMFNKHQKYMAWRPAPIDEAVYIPSVESGAPYVADSKLTLVLMSIGTSDLFYHVDFHFTEVDHIGRLRINSYETWNEQCLGDMPQDELLTARTEYRMSKDILRIAAPGTAECYEDAEPGPSLVYRFCLDGPEKLIPEFEEV